MMEWRNTQNMKWRNGGKSPQILKDGMSPLILKNNKNCKQRRIKKIITGYIKTSLWNRWCSNWKMAQELHNNNDISVFLSILHKIHRIKHSTSEPLFNAHISSFKLQELQWRFSLNIVTRDGTLKQASIITQQSNTQIYVTIETFVQILRPDKRSTSPLQFCVVIIYLHDCHICLVEHSYTGT